MVRRAAMVLLGVLVAGACSAPVPPAAPPAVAAPPGRAPVSPPGTEGLLAAPCSRRIDLTASSAEQRAFEPGARATSGRTILRFRLRGPARRWTWESSRPSALRFEDAGEGAVALVAGEPGATLVRVLVEGDEGAEEASALVSVPMFVRVDADGDLAATLDRDLGLGGREREVMIEAKRVIEAVLSRANLRVAFRAWLGEELPATIPEGGFIEATMHGDVLRCVPPRQNPMFTEFGGYGEGDDQRRLTRAKVHVCPGVFARHPDTMAAMIKHRARLLAKDDTAALFTTIAGRALGELLAHEIAHQLLGCDRRGERRSWRCHDRLPHSLMNRGGERSFSDRTGVTLRATALSSTWRDDFGAPGTYEDGGVAAVNHLSPDDQAVIDRILPVPPALVEAGACP